MAEHRELTAEAYHADPAIGAGMIEDFLSSRRFYHGRHVTHTIQASKTSAPMELGSLVHMLILEPDRFHSEIVVAPMTGPDAEPWDQRKKAHKVAWAEFAATANGRRIIDAETAYKAATIADVAMSKPLVRQLLGRDGQPEFSIFWQDKETGLQLKIRLDWFASVCLDMKTTRDPSPCSFAADCAHFGYHRRAAHYRAGIYSYTGSKRPIVHVAIGTTPPHSVAHYELVDKDNTGWCLGEFQWGLALSQLAKCYESDDWSEPWEREICTLELPRWAFTQHHYMMGGLTNG